ncbi:MAG: prepilin-type N-terminal cleavage/methylation domain-containing protein [Candidatus Omnitrophica bacterium]|nr:prepilin-type N-terminal cleavage/methylation domain-containing protein [Candidatus Omnitrophota bacterium]
MKKGFTLIELIVVIAIIAILAAIIAPNAFKAIEKARVSGTSGDYRSIKTAAMSYYADTGGWPANANTAGFIGDDAASGWDGPYLEKWPTRNAWGGTYSWVNSNSGCFTTAGTDERFISITTVPAAAAGKIDTALDDGNLTAGNVRHAGTTLIMHVSDDTY